VSARTTYTTNAPKLHGKRHALKTDLCTRKEMKRIEKRPVHTLQKRPVSTEKNALYKATYKHEKRFVNMNRDLCKLKKI